MFVLPRRLAYAGFHSINAIVSDVVMIGKGKRQTLKEKVESIYSEDVAEYEKVTPTKQNCSDMVAWIMNDMVTFNRGLVLEATALRKSIASMSGELLVDNNGRGHFLTLTMEETADHQVLQRTLALRCAHGYFARS